MSSSTLPSSVSASAGAQHFDQPGQLGMFRELLQTSNKPVFVDFFATWCGPCQLAAPIVEKLAHEFAGKVDVIKLDIDQLREAAADHEVRSIPTTIVFKNGQEVAREVGFSGEHKYREMLQTALGS
jgi:thioredoxin 1